MIKTIDEFAKTLEELCPRCNECSLDGICVRKFNFKCPKCGTVKEIMGEDAWNFFQHGCSDCLHKKEFEDVPASLEEEEEEVPPEEDHDFYKTWGGYTI